MRHEPVLRPEDRAVWDTWIRTAAVHAGTRAHSRALDSARSVIDRAIASAPTWAAMWSGGKDSTVMVHLLRGRGVPAISEKDDLDYPGEREYVERLALEWALDLEIVTPPISPSRWMAEHAHEMMAGDDIHSRAAGLSKACFYDVVEKASAPYAGVFLGLRSAESKARNVNRAVHGDLYLKRSGQWVAAPLSDWRDIDVYAYAATHGIELLPVYRCVALMHAREPWRIRKSWWLPGSSSRFGGVVWLRHYYPSLYRQLRSWMPDAALLG